LSQRSWTGLVDPTIGRDACGVGFVADIKGARSREIVDDGLEILRRLSHRAACGADPETGDGAGILIQLPERMFRAEAGRTYTFDKYFAVFTGNDHVTAPLPDVALDTVRRALHGSLCIGAYTETGTPSSAGATKGTQVGLVRIISDHATYAYLCDVYVLEEHRRHGLAKAMLALTMRHPKLQGLRTWSLRTRDAHGLYAQFGFKPVEHPESYMALRFPDVYRQPDNDE